MLRKGESGGGRGDYVSKTEKNSDVSPLALSIFLIAVANVKLLAKIHKFIDKNTFSGTEFQNHHSQ